MINENNNFVYNFCKILFFFKGNLMVYTIYGRILILKLEGMWLVWMYRNQTLIIIVT